MTINNSTAASGSDNSLIGTLLTVQCAKRRFFSYDDVADLVMSIRSSFISKGYSHIVGIARGGLSTPLHSSTPHR